MKAKTLSKIELERTLARCDPMMAVAVLLTHRAGLRAMEVAALDWSMVTDASGNPADVIDLPNVATKARTGAGRLPISSDLARALLHWSAMRRHPSSGPVICGPRCEALSADAMRLRIKAIYRKTGLTGATSHSGRRSFATQLAKSIPLADLQLVMRHARPSTTLTYVDASASPIIAAAVEGLTA